MGGPDIHMGGPDMAPPTPQRSGCPGQAEASFDPRDMLDGGRPGLPGAPLDGFVPVTRASELSPGSMKWVAIDRERVLIANVDGVFYALQDSCGHRRAPLSKGTLWGYVIECPLHFAQFDVRTGKLLSGPAGADVPTYQVLVEGDTVYVKR